MRDVEDAGVNLRIAQAESLLDKYFVLDDREAFVILPCLEAGTELGASRVNVREFVQRFIEMFDKTWVAAKPAHLAIAVMSSLRESFLEAASKLGHIARAVAAGIFDLGIYSRPDYIRIEENDVSSAIASLLKAGLLRNVSASDPRPIANVVDQLITALFLK
jgi:hypothetical protein